MAQPSLIPVWIRTYQRKNFKFDLVAGLTVGVMLIPQAMAYAMLAGIPPIYGLYASTFPAIVYGLLGTCRQLSVGPTAMIAMLTSAGAGMMAQETGGNYLFIVAGISLLVGIIQSVLGTLRLGFLIQFLSMPVMIGFTSAAAIIIAFSQLKFILGIQYPTSQYIQVIVAHLAQKISGVHLLTIVVSLVSMAILVAFQKWRRQFPGALVVVVLSILCTYLFQLNAYGLDIIGNIPRGIPEFVIPRFDMNATRLMLSTGFAIALISFMESSAVSQILWSRHNDYRVRHNAELISIGLSNITSAFMLSAPVSGGMSRSMVNDNAGARTGLASIISALLILMTLLLFTPLFYYLPLSVLAVIILIAVYKLFRLKEAMRLWQMDRKDFWMMLATFIGTLTLGITNGIGIGVLLSLAWIIFEATYPHHAELGQVLNTTYFRNTRRFQNVVVSPGVLIYRFDAPLFFANANTFQSVLLDYKSQRKDPIHTIILDFESVNTIDSSAITILEQTISELEKEKVTTVFAEVKGPVRDKLYAAGLIQKLGDHHFFVTVQDAVQYVSDGQRHTSHDVALQTKFQPKS